MDVITKQTSAVAGTSCIITLQAPYPCSQHTCCALQLLASSDPFRVRLSQALSGLHTVYSIFIQRVPSRMWSRTRSTLFAKYDETYASGLLRSAIFASPEVCIFEVLYIVGDIYTRMTWCHLYRRPIGAILRAAVAASNESAIRVLTAASSVIGGLDAASALSAGLTLATIFKSLVSVCMANVAGATGRRAIVGEWVKPTSRRKSSSPRPPSSPSSWAPCMCRRCMFRMGRRGCCHTGGRSRRRRRSAVRRRGCCGSTQRPGWPWRPWWLFNDTVS